MMFPYALINREACVWHKIVCNYLIPKVHLIYVTRDHICLVYALMMQTNVNIGVVIKSVVRKARVHRGMSYAFSGLITRICR